MGEGSRRIWNWEGLVIKMSLPLFDVVDFPVILDFTTSEFSGFPFCRRLK
jgi:hypothetical protein